MDAGAPLVLLVQRVQADEILLRMAGHLRARPPHRPPLISSMLSRVHVARYTAAKACMLGPLQAARAGALLRRSDAGAACKGGCQRGWTTTSLHNVFKVKANLIEVTCNGGWWPARAWVGVREMTKLREMLRQSPLPYFCRPSRNSRCSSSVHGMPLRRSWSPFPFVCASAHAGAGRGSLVILLKHRTGSDQTVFSYSLSNPHWLNHLKGGTVLSQSEGARQQTEGKSDSAHRSGGDAQRLGRA